MSVQWREYNESVRLYAIKLSDGHKTEYDDVVSFDVSVVKNPMSLDKKVAISFARDEDAKLTIKMTLSSGQEIPGDIHFPL